MTQDPYLKIGLDHWQMIADLLNSTIKQDNYINIDNKSIWTILNHWSNEDWEAVLLVVGQLLLQHPELFKTIHRDTFQQAASTLVKYSTEQDRVLDRKGNKKIAWKMLMTLREVWNECNGVYLPNRNPF